ncbi:SpoIID/LytB domain-containing protein [Oscillospiraceae bacterium DSM 107454]|uniref:SpoIID/LytB domain-containing protein n=2 Tax=Ructibacterium gallinarum TaxID=2779355 RepID=A0A9D5R8C5_9FIRM|nr:SpoIID/LytB domain-containing protein [Ructibacterium gallinarum]
MMKLKRITAVFIAVLLLLLPCFSFTALADYSIPQYIRVGLFFGNSALPSVTLQSPWGFELGRYEGRDFLYETETDQTEVTVSVGENAAVVVKDPNGETLYIGNSAGVLPRASGMDQITTVDGAEYRGGIDCLPDGNLLTVVNVVFLDHYLYGVVSREMSPSWPIEALKAQAVCARNYAINNLDKHGSQGFDLCNTVDCQAYSGVKAEADGSYAPVDETTRQVLTYDGELAELYYASSMGPTTENVENVWGNSLPYLVSVDNSFEDTENIPNGKWSGSLTCEEATAIMRNKGYDVGAVTQIKVLEYTPNGRVLRMEVTGTNGSKIFEREACRTIFNTITKSQMFTVVGDGEGGQTAPKIHTTDGTDVAEQAIDKMIMLTAAGRASLESNILYVTNGEYQQTYEIVASEPHENTSFYFEGTGWGHGVGMSQYGARGMAEAGYDYLEILRHYFLGTNLENAY